MQKNSQAFSMQDAQRLANSDAGQQLLALLQSSGGNELQAAISQASKGSYDQAKQTLSALLASQEAQDLLKQLEENP